MFKWQWRTLLLLDAITSNRKPGIQMFGHAIIRSKRIARIEGTTEECVEGSSIHRHADRMCRAPNRPSSGWLDKCIKMYSPRFKRNDITSSGCGRTPLNSSVLMDSPQQGHGLSVGPRMIAGRGHTINLMGGQSDTQLELMASVCTFNYRPNGRAPDGNPFCRRRTNVGSLVTPGGISFCSSGDRTN